MAEQKDMSGVLFKNHRRRDGKQDPNAQGSCTIDGRRYWISAWTNTVERGKHEGEKYLSIKFRVADDDVSAHLRPRSQTTTCPARS